MDASFDVEVKPKYALRINTLKTNGSFMKSALEKKGVKLFPIPGVKNGFWYEADFSLGATPEYLLGHYYLQEAASQLPVLALEPKAGDVVLDMAAAPGSKTTQLAQLMRDKGVIVALDSDHLRIDALRNNLERMGVSCAVVLKKDARFIADLKISFDKILLDAPCSGNFCIEEDFFAKRTLEDIRLKSRVQKDLLKAAYKVLKTGGTLVYSTCSLEPEEDEIVVDWFIKNYPNMHLETIDIPLGSPGVTSFEKNIFDKSLSLTRRFWPHKSLTQGFFIAKLVKDE
jgi:NOL1/NOP2/sun family putative RNA methylase